MSDSLLTTTSQNMDGVSVFGVNPIFFNEPTVEIPTFGDKINKVWDDIGGMGTLSTVGTIIGGIGGIMNARDQRKYQKEVLGMERARIARDRERQDNFENGMKDAWK
jgi:hypothetical protein